MDPAGATAASSTAGGTSCPTWSERFGPDDALRLAHLVDEAVGTIGDWCEANDVDAWYRHGGYLA